MTNRRSFIAGMLAAGLAPKPSWADVGSPEFLSAGMKPDGTYVLCGLNAEGQIAFELPLPARGHAAVAHPSSPEAVAFARRPGTYAIVVNCTDGQERARLEAPVGRHFYGHGTLSAEGDFLFTTENDFEAARGVVGVWDRRNGYERIGEFWSGGVGPHDIKLMPGGRTLVVANGGIETHPETGRTKLNLSTMRPNLSYLDLNGQAIDRIELSDEFRKNSIRHLAVSEGSKVVFAMQWQGDLAADLPLMGVHDQRAENLELVDAASVRRMNGYLGSIAITHDGSDICTTSPRSGIVQEFHRTELINETRIEDVCGVSATTNGFFLTSGRGLAKPVSRKGVVHPIAWDNHLVSI